MADLAGPRTHVKDGRTWALGAIDDVSWINDAVIRGTSITASIPPVFAAYATLVFPLDLAPSDPQIEVDSDRAGEDRFDDALVRVLGEHTGSQSLWLGFLDTGASDVVFGDAPRTRVYGWPYVLVEAGLREARTWRSEARWFTALPELMFPADRSWLVSSLWDDAWAGVGGSAALINALLTERDLVLWAERTNPSVPDMWPSALPDVMHERLLRQPAIVFACGRWAWANSRSVVGILLNGVFDQCLEISIPTASNRQLRLVSHRHIRPGLSPAPVTRDWCTAQDSR